MSDSLMDYVAGMVAAGYAQKMNAGGQ